MKMVTLLYSNEADILTKNIHVHHYCINAFMLYTCNKRDTGLVYCFLSVFGSERRLQAKYTSLSIINTTSLVYGTVCWTMLSMVAFCILL